MERYVKLEELGRGSYGVVWRAFDTHSYEYVAIKQLFDKYDSVDECLNLIEVKALMKINHPNIIKLKEIVKENGTLNLVFEYMECDVYNILQRQILPETVIRDMCFQILHGLAYMHRNGYIHRDLKPANLLVYQKSVKIGDLGQARETDSELPCDYNVTTELYRAPEVFLRSPAYDTSVDMWAMGAIMAELFTNEPLFLGYSEAPDVMRNICYVLGTPTNTTWKGGLQLAQDIFYPFPQLPGEGISTFLPNASSDAINLITTLLSWDPTLRPTAEEALQHPFFHCYNRVPKPINARNSVPPGFEKVLHPKVNEQTRCLETCKGDFEDMSRFLPENLLDF